MNRSGLFFLVLAIVIASTLSWLNSSWISYQYFQIAKKEKKIDYYLSNFTLINFQESGKMLYLAKGKHLIHQQATGETTIFDPILEAHNTDSSTLSITSKKAIQMTKNGNIELQDDVTILYEIQSKEKNNSSSDFKIKTDVLTYNPVKKEIYSDSIITFTSNNNGYFKGKGFTGKIDEQEFRIHSNVQAHYLPKQ